MTITIVALGSISAGVAVFFSLRRREKTAVTELTPPAAVVNIQQAAGSPKPPRGSGEGGEASSGLELQKESREEALSRVLDELRVELSLLDVDGLCQRADLEGVADNLIEQARTRGDVSPTDALVELIVAQRRASLRSRKLNRSISLFQGP